MSWLAGSFLVLGAALVAGFAWYERSHPSSRVLALIATLAALAALGRIAFAPLPNVKPTTDIVLLAGYVLGGAPGFVVGAVAALASNLFFGQGPWTPWQMVAWGLVGVGGAALARVFGRELGRWSLTLACMAAGAVYGGILNFSLWVLWSGDHTAAKLAAVYTTSVPFDLAHIAGNAVFCLAFGPALVGALRRYRARFEVRWLPAASPGRVAGLVLVTALVVPAALSTPPARADAPAKTIRFLASSQNRDGGFGMRAGAPSDAMHTGWAALALAATGRNPLDVRRSGRDPIGWLIARPGQTGDLGAVSRASLALSAAGRSPARFGRRDLLAEMLAAQRDDGSFEGRVNTSAFVVFALRAAGRRADDPVIQRAARWIVSQANPDGGFSFAGRRGPSGADDTATALQALAAAGMRRSDTVARAVVWLETRQNRDGGFGLSRGAPSNAQSTAFVVQALVAAGRDPRRVRRGSGRDPLAYLRGLVQRDGSVRYSRLSGQTPVWVTAQAVLALERKPFPLRAVPRARRVRAGLGAAAGRGAAAARSAAAARAAPSTTARGTMAPTRGGRDEATARGARAGVSIVREASGAKEDAVAAGLARHARVAGAVLAQLL